MLFGEDRENFLSTKFVVHAFDRVVVDSVLFVLFCFGVILKSIVILSFAFVDFSDVIICSGTNNIGLWAVGQGN